MAESWASEDEAEAHCSCFCEKNALIIELAAAARTNYTFGLVVATIKVSHMQLMHKVMRMITECYVFA